MLPCAILCGGLATRLRPVTEKIPKSLIPIDGEPFLAHQLRLLRTGGVTEVVLCVGYLGEQIREFAGDGGKFGLSISYSFDGEKLLGTAGAIRKALPFLNGPFFVLYGDSYLPCDYQDVARAFATSHRRGLMTIYRNEGLYDASNVEAANGVILRYDKRHKTPEMRFIDYGLGAFERPVFEQLPPDEVIDLAQVYQNLLAAGDLAAYEVKERFFEIGSAQGIRDLEQYIRRGMNFSQQFLAEMQEIARQLDVQAIEKMAQLLADVRERDGRLFILGVGGSAANASHAVNDFRKIAGIEAYAPTDNVSELTARTNDEGWPTVFDGWLKISKLRNSDAILVFSVGGGNLEKQVSPNLVTALQYAKSTGAKVLGIVGRDGGYTAKVADACVIIPTVNTAHVTPHSEAFQAVIWHLLVSHPSLKAAETRWESI